MKIIHKRNWETSYLSCYGYCHNLGRCVQPKDNLPQFPQRLTNDPEKAGG